MKILVTGSTGFLGQALVKELKADVLVCPTSYQCDLRQADSLLKFNQHQYDQIFHLAVWTQAGDFCMKHPGEQWMINQLINTHMLKWWHECQPQAKLVTIGTSCAYAEGPHLLESNYLKDTPHDSLLGYGMTKRMLYVGQVALNRQFAHRYLTVIPSTLYGPYYHADGRQLHFIFDLIRKIMRGKKFGEPVSLWGDGWQKRELIYIDDFVQILLALNGRVDNELVNVGGGEEYPIRHFAQIICNIVGYPFEQIHFDTSKYVGAKSKCLCTDKLHRLLPGVKLTSLEEGLRRTIDWFEEEAAVLLPAKAAA